MKATFAERVRTVVRGIPKGKTMTYKEVSLRAGSPHGARAVGMIMAHNTDNAVPCHRVIRSDGNLGGYNTINGPSKAALLKREGALK